MNETIEAILKDISAGIRETSTTLKSHGTILKTINESLFSMDSSIAAKGIIKSKSPSADLAIATREEAELESQSDNNKMSELIDRVKDVITAVREQSDKLRDFFSEYITGKGSLGRTIGKLGLIGGAAFLFKDELANLFDANMQKGVFRELLGEDSPFYKVIEKIPNGIIYALEGLLIAQFLPGINKLVNGGLMLSIKGLSGAVAKMGIPLASFALTAAAAAAAILAVKDTFEKFVALQDVKSKADEALRNSDLKSEVTAERNIAKLKEELNDENTPAERKAVIFQQIQRESLQNALTQAENDLRDAQDSHINIFSNVGEKIGPQTGLPFFFGKISSGIGKKIDDVRLAPLKRRVEAIREMIQIKTNEINEIKSGKVDAQSLNRKVIFDSPYHAKPIGSPMEAAPSKTPMMLTPMEQNFGSSLNDAQTSLNGVSISNRSTSSNNYNINAPTIVHNNGGGGGGSTLIGSTTNMDPDLASMIRTFA